MTEKPSINRQFLSYEICSGDLKRIKALSMILKPDKTIYET